MQKLTSCLSVLVSINLRHLKVPPTRRASEMWRAAAETKRNAGLAVTTHGAF
jgi:hypothetical protein